MVTLPSVTSARHVPHTPPLHANGRSARTRWAPSRIGTPGGIVTVVPRPSRITVTSAPGPAAASACCASGGGSSST